MSTKQEISFYTASRDAGMAGFDKQNQNNSTVIQYKCTKEIGSGTQPIILEAV